MSTSATRSVPSTVRGTPTLRGRRIFLSASFPVEGRKKRYFTTADPDELTQAIVALVRAVFAARGRIVCGGHPSTTPLLMMIAEEYMPRVLKDRRQLNGSKQARLTVYQSKAFADALPPATTRMSKLHLGRIRWSPVSPSERRLVGRTDNPRLFDKSLTLMRHQMLSEWPFAAAIFIGGMEGIEIEAESFAQVHPNRPAYYIGGPGGAARELARKWERLSRSDQRPWAHELATSREYPALMQRLVARVANYDGEL